MEIQIQLADCIPKGSRYISFTKIDKLIHGYTSHIRNNRQISRKNSYVRVAYMTKFNAPQVHKHYITYHYGV